MGTQTNFLLLFCYRPGALPCTCLFCSLHLLWWGAWKNAPHTRHKMSQLMIHETQLFRFNFFQIIGFTPLYSLLAGWPGCLVTHRERINTENKEIEIVTREHQNSRDLGIPRVCLWPVQWRHPTGKGNNAKIVFKVSKVNRHVFQIVHTPSCYCCCNSFKSRQLRLQHAWTIGLISGSGGNFDNFI